MRPTQKYSDGFVLGGTAVVTVFFMLQLAVLGQSIGVTRTRLAEQLIEERYSIPVDFSGLPRFAYDGADPYCCHLKPIFSVEPDYPEFAWRIHQPGYVTFEYIVEEDGSISNVRIIEAWPRGFGFEAAAMKVFPKWRFKSDRKVGKPVRTKDSYTLDFTPQD